jgi:hypothetical protein
MSEEGTIEISFEQLGLTKDLDKMTAKELRDLAIEKLPMITGASGMSKEELVSTIKEIFGIEDEGPSISPHKEQIFAIKREIKDLRAQRLSTNNRLERDKFRKKINKLKKETRRLARANA